ncbi:MAG: NUDIX hydrolase [Propionibacteriaceae bacterium]|nr:NUDIX hydrolase [Propionibacteriaceae bacterium]
MERTEATLVPAADGVLVDLRCSVALIRRNQVLLLHRAAHPDVDNDGDWVLPGGHPADGESMRACAAREIFEETGLRVDVGRCLFVYEIVGPGEVGRRVELVFAATAENLDELGARESDRHPELVHLDDLTALDLRPPLAGHLRGLRFPQPTGAAYLGNLWRPRRDAGGPVPLT